MLQHARRKRRAGFLQQVLDIARRDAEFGRQNAGRECRIGEPGSDACNDVPCARSAQDV
jgi:hypothetical protein